MSAGNGRPLRVAYVDPPYVGRAKWYPHPRAGAFDRAEGHVRLLGRLEALYPDGWAYSCSVPMLRALLPAAPARARVAAWVKPWVRFKPWVNPAYTWEPVIFAGGRKRGRGSATARDSLACPIAMGTGTPGAKPEAFCVWVFGLLGLEPGDRLVDLFPGSGAVGRAWERYRREGAHR